MILISIHRIYIIQESFGCKCQKIQLNLSYRGLLADIIEQVRGSMSFPGDSDVKKPICTVGHLGSIPGLGRSPGEGNGCPLQYFCLENSMDKGTLPLQSVGLQRVGHEWATNTLTLRVPLDSSTGGPRRLSLSLFFSSPTIHITLPILALFMSRPYFMW